MGLNFNERVRMLRNLQRISKVEDRKLWESYRREELARNMDNFEMFEEFSEIYLRNHGLFIDGKKLWLLQLSKKLGFFPEFPKGTIMLNVLWCPKGEESENSTIVVTNYTTSLNWKLSLVTMDVGGGFKIYDQKENFWYNYEFAYPEDEVLRGKEKMSESVESLGARLYYTTEVYNELVSQFEQHF